MLASAPPSELDRLPLTVPVNGPFELFASQAATIARMASAHGRLRFIRANLCRRSSLVHYLMDAREPAGPARYEDPGRAPEERAKHAADHLRHDEEAEDEQRNVGAFRQRHGLDVGARQKAENARRRLGTWFHGIGRRDDILPDGLAALWLGLHDQH